MESSTCHFSGDSDIYGLGIRIGLYLQWFSFAIANFFDLESTEAANATYLAFQVALALAAFVITFGAQILENQPRQIEIAILLYLFYGGIFSIWGTSKAWQPGRTKSAWDQLLRSFVRTMIGAFSTWFWTTINRPEYLSEPPNCTTFIFFFRSFSGNAVQGLGIFFAILAASDCVLSLYRLRRGAQRLYTLFQESLRPLPEGYRLEISQFLNESCYEWVQNQVYHVSGLPEAFGKSLRVEDVTYNYVVLRNDFQPKRCAISHKTLLSGRIETDKARLRSQLEKPKKYYMGFWERVLRVKEDPEVVANATKMSWKYKEYAAGKINAGEMVEGKSATEFIQKVFTRSYFLNWRHSSKNQLGSETGSTMSDYVWKVTDPFFVFYYQILVIAYLLINLSICVWTIVAIELMLVWNNVDGANTAASVGQLIPLAIGIVVFITTIVDVRTKFKKIRIEDDLPFHVDDVRLARLSSPQAIYHMQTCDSKWH